jgi:hypothetical protein
MTLAFTVCSNNFLAQAKTTLQSLQRHHPEIRQFIFLVDKADQRIDYSFLEPAELVVMSESVLPGFDEWVLRYNVIELNCAIRPFIIEYLSKLFPGANRVYYIDPDMVIYDRLDELDRILQKDDIVITPHFFQPIAIDGKWPFENLALTYGNYNLGFLAVNPTTLNCKNFLAWWGERTSRFGQVDPANGYFTDQIWFNLVPLFFENVHILRHPGYNMAGWNLQERSIHSYGDDGKVFLDTGVPLVIYHFSSWNYKEPGILSPYYNRYSFDDRPEMVKLYRDYHQSLLANRIDFFQSIPCALPYNRKEVKRSTVQKILLPGVNLLRKVWQKI